MARPRTWWGAVAASFSGCLLLGSVGCSVIATSGELTDGCPADEKVCETNEGYLDCVQRSSPEYGCGADTCNPCEIANAVARCSKSNVCIISTCDANFVDCDDNVDNGCEVDTGRDEKNCGGCGVQCSLDNASAVCASGLCTVSRCNDGWVDCDGDGENGCECDGVCDEISEEKVCVQ